MNWMHDVKELFEGDYFDNYTLEPVTDAQIELVQQKLKVTLPDSYIALMRQQNGGELRKRKLVVGEEIVSVDYINGIGSKSGEGIWLSSTLKREWGLSNRFVYLFGDGHTWLTLDYRRYTGNNPPVTYIDLELGTKEVIANDFEQFLTTLEYDEHLQRTAYEYGSELEFFPREEVEREMQRCNNAYVMSAGMIYYGFTDDDLTWYFTQLHQYVGAFIEEGIRYYEMHARSFTMLDEFLDYTIALIRKRDVKLTDYPVAVELLQLLKTFPAKYDYDSMIQRKTMKIVGYFNIQGEDSNV